MQRYRTLYFDTQEVDLYWRHHAGYRTRYNVRSCQYRDTELACLEGKQKTGADRTTKQRLPTPQLITALHSETRAFLRQYLPAAMPALEPKLWNTFGRMMLVNKDAAERVTLDVDLRFSGNGDAIALPRVMIAEVKRANHGRCSPFMRLMREQCVRSRGFSKDCIGVSLSNPAIKHNNFKPHQRLLCSLVHRLP